MKIFIQLSSMALVYTRVSCVYPKKALECLPTTKSFRKMGLVESTEKTKPMKSSK